jgi:tetratricopeptide (TPR) repeat protein
LEEAETILTDVIAREPRHDKARAAMGRLLLARGRARDALPYLESAASGEGVDALLDLAAAYLALPEPARAAQTAARALERNPGHPRALALLGHALVVQGRRAEGVGALERALALRPRRAEVWRELAEGFQAAGEAKSAGRCREESSRRARAGSRASAG